MPKTRGRTLPSRKRPARSVMPRDAQTDPEAKVPPPAEPAADETRVVESRRGGALVPADSLQRYLAEIRRIPILSREEEHELAVRWHEHEDRQRSEEHTSELQSQSNLVCRLLLEKKK